MDQHWFQSRGKHFIAAALLLTLIAVPAGPGRAEKKTDSKPIPVTLQKRVADASGKYRPVKEAFYWKPDKTAIIVCDMWDDHTCKQAAKRVAEMAPAMNETLKA